LGAVYDSTVSLVIRAQDEASATLGQVGDVFRALGRTIDAAMAHTPGFDKIGQSAHATARDAAEMDSALGRVGEAARAAGEHFNEATGLTDHFHESLARIKDTAVSFTLGSLGFEAFNQAEIGVEKFGEGLIQANATAESLTQTMAAIYHSGAEAQQAVAWMNQFALAAPFTRESIMRASTTIAALGMDITQVIPALGNLAAVMGTDMPTAAQAFMDAYEGRFQMLQRDLHVSKQQLEAYGLQIDATGKLVQSSFAPAFERFVAANYPKAMALQMQTFNGQMSNATDQFQNFERIAGHGIFLKLKQETGDFLTYLQTHQQEVNVFASAVGTVLGGAMNTVFIGVHAVVDALPGMINLWNNVTSAISGPLSVAFTVASTALAGFWNFLSVTVMPRVGAAINTMIGWWQEHGAAIITNLNVIAGDIGTWFTWILDHASVFFQAFTGEWQVGWSVVSNLFLGALDLLSGNWAAFGNDMVSLFAGVEIGIVNIVAGIEKVFIGMLEALQGPLNDAFHGINQAWVAVADSLLLVFTLVETTTAKLLNGVLGNVNRFIAMLETGLNKIPGIGDKFKVNQQTIPELSPARIGQNILSARKAIEDAVGLPSDKKMTFGKTEQQADAGVQARANELIKNITDNYRAMTGKIYDKSFNAGAVQGPKLAPFAALLAEWKKMTSGPGLKLDMSRAGAITKWLGEALTVPKLTGAEDPATKASKLASVDRTQFDWDLIRKASHATLETDVAKILKDMGKEPGMTQAGLNIENYNDQQRIKDLYKKDDSAIVARLNMQFNLDKLNNASAQVLMRDEKAILDQMQRDGSTQLQIAYERKLLDQQITKTKTPDLAGWVKHWRDLFGQDRKNANLSGELADLAQFKKADLAYQLALHPKDHALAVKLANDDYQKLAGSLTNGLKALRAPRIGTGFQKSVYGYTSRQQVGQGVGLGETLVTFGGRVGKDPAQQMIEKLETQVQQLTQQNQALTALLGAVEDGTAATISVRDAIARGGRATPGVGIGNPLRVQGLATAVR